MYAGKEKDERQKQKADLSFTKKANFVSTIR